MSDPNPTTPKPLCDYCNSKPALLYCRADTAKLCLPCDNEVHSTNPLFSKHTRSLLCDTCHSSPASLLCETDRLLLCHNCDWERHRLDGSHRRRPVEGFSGCLSGPELGAHFGFDDVGWEKDGECGEGFFVWESSEVFGFEDLSDSGSGFGFRALDVPPLPKNRNAVCGQYKDEMLHQLRDLTRLDSGLNSRNQVVERIKVHESLSVGCDLQLRAATLEPDMQPCSLYEENVFQWLSDPVEVGNQDFPPFTFLKSDFEESSVVPDKQFDIGGSIIYEKEGLEIQSQNQVPSRTLVALPKAPPHEFNSQERDSAISRYKEKRKTRRFDKHIRYESRKVRAESRTRIRGRFAKMNC